MGGFLTCCWIYSLPHGHDTRAGQLFLSTTGHCSSLALPGQQITGRAPAMISGSEVVPSLSRLCYCSGRYVSFKRRLLLLTTRLAVVRLASLSVNLEFWIMLGQIVMPYTGWSWLIADEQLVSALLPSIWQWVATDPQQLHDMRPRPVYRPLCTFEAIEIPLRDT